MGRPVLLAAALALAAVAILIDPFHDHRNAYVFATNPNGAEFDALLADLGKEFGLDWRGVWEVAGVRIPRIVG